MKVEGFEKMREIKEFFEDIFDEHLCNIKNIEQGILAKESSENLYLYLLKELETFKEKLDETL